MGWFHIKNTKSILKNLYAQLTIVSVLMIMITLLLFVYIYPTFWAVVSPQLENIDDSAVVTFIQLAPFLMVVAIILSIVWYVIPRREEY